MTGSLYCRAYGSYHWTAFGPNSVVTSVWLDCSAQPLQTLILAPPPPSLSCSAVGGTSCRVLVSWHPCRLVMSGVVPPNQVPLRPHYSHFYLLHIAAVHHLMMLDPATDGAKQAGSCSLSGSTSNWAFLKLNSITLKCYVSIPFTHSQVRVFLLVNLFVPSLCLILFQTTAHSAKMAVPTQCLS